MSDDKEHKRLGLKQYSIAVSIVGFIGLIVSIYLLMDYKEPLLNIWKLILKSLFG